MRPVSRRLRASSLARSMWFILALGSASAVEWTARAGPAQALAGRSGLGIGGANEESGRWLRQWTLKTADTTLTLGVRSDQKMCLCRLAGPAGWNWTKLPSPFPLVSHVDLGGEHRELKWGFKQGAEDQADGSRVTILFTNADPSLELISVWQARGGPGPVRHTMFIRNHASRRVTLYRAGKHRCPSGRSGRGHQRLVHQ